MFLIVDACILFSFFKEDSSRRKLIEELSEFKLISPEFAFTELLKDKGRIIKYSEINELKFLFLFSLLEMKIDGRPGLEYKEFLSEASKLAPHPKDEPYFALALKLNCPIWSDEEKFKSQNKVDIFTTERLLKKLKS